MANKVLLLLFLFFYVNAQSQTLINTEKIAFLEDKNYVVGAELKYAGSYGNLDIQQFSSSFLFGYKIKSHHLFRAMGGFEFLSKDNSELKNAAFTQLRYNYIFSSKIRSFHFYQLQSNKTVLLNKRELYGSGLRISFFNKDSSKVSFNLGLGLMYENEFLDKRWIGVNDIPNTSLFRMADFVSIKYSINKKIELLNVLYYQPSISEFSDFRLFNDFSVVFKFSKRYSFEFSAKYRNDSKPPSTIEKEDLNTAAGIIINI